MSALDERPVRVGGGRILLSACLLLAAVAAAALILGVDDPRLLRLGIVAALWAALLGAFAAVRTRRDVHTGGAGVVELRARYHLELQREVAARRQHEMRVERELRERARREERVEIAALRTEVAALRANLQQLMGGELMVERVALHAESTRLLALRDAGSAAPGRLPSPQAPQAARTGPVRSAPVRTGTVPKTEWQPAVESLPLAAGPGTARVRGTAPAATTTAATTTAATTTAAAATAAAMATARTATTATATTATMQAPPRPRHDSWQRGPIEPIPSRPPVPPPIRPPAAPAHRRHSAHDGADPHGHDYAHATAGRRRAASTAMSSGSSRPGAHTAGLPVDALLAAYGSSVAPRHRRRRADG